MTQSVGLACVQFFAPAPGKPVRWRLLSGNNREAGRSAGSYSDEHAARTAVVGLQKQTEALAAAVRRQSGNLWRWQLSLGDELLVVSSREYDRMIRCEQAMQAFLRALPSATVAMGVMVSSARRWETRALAVQSRPPATRG